MDNSQTPAPENFSLGSLLNRITSPTPDFQKKLQILALKIGAFAVLIISLSALKAVVIPEIVLTIAKITTIICGTSAAHAQTTKAPSTDTTTPTDPTDDSQAAQG